MERRNLSSGAIFRFLPNSFEQREQKVYTYAANSIEIEKIFRGKEVTFMPAAYKFPYGTLLRYLPLMYMLPYDLLIRWSTLRRLSRNGPGSSKASSF